MKHRVFLLFILLLVISFPVFSSSKQNHAAIKGAGIGSCQMLVDTVKNKGNIALFAGWMDGFVSASNINAKNTFDFVPWQSTNTLMEAILNYCVKHPKVNFFKATSEMLRALYKNRIVDDAKHVKISIAGKTVFLYAEVINRIQKQLADLKLYNGKINGKYDSKTQNSMKKFQKEHKLPVNGLPDQRTLAFLLRPI